MLDISGSVNGGRVIGGIRIESNVPLPAHGGGRRLNKYPFAEMAIGDSFCVPWEGEGTRGRVMNRAAHFAKSRGWRFTSRHIEAGLRVWRIS